MAAVLEWRLTGGASNADPDASLGGDMSSEAVSSTALNNLWDNVGSVEASSGDTEYRAIDLYNSGDATATGIEIWISTPTPSTDSAITLGQDETATQLLDDESTAPDDPVVAFSEPLVGSKLSVDNIAALAAARFFIKRVIGAEAVNYANDQYTITVQYA